MAIQLSIIIVNYNVKAFLEQCLYSVYKAAKNIKTEIFVVDNNSIDDSVEMLQKNFPEVKLICNNENKGFAYACNQALKLSNGKYNLLLNPDTLVNEESLKLCLNFMEEHDEAGALGVKMIDGNGKFLPESKRSLPTASSAFYKMFGITALFPKSKTFGKYQLKYLNQDEINTVEVLSGAFMFIRKKVLDQIGLLDESFFMYGEDIDLSYRIINAGYKNYYFPLTTIIHYKGESTKKSSIRYVKLFYQAMLIFSNKHYKGKYLSIFQFLIQLAIYFRAILSAFYRIAQSIYLPVIDFAITYLTFIQIVDLWERIKFSTENVYSNLLTNVYIPIYIVIWLIFVIYFKGNSPFAKFSQVLKAVFAGTALILVGYSLLPEDYRFSRALILIGAGICFTEVSLTRAFMRLYLKRVKGISKNQRKSALLIGNFSKEGFIEFRKKLENKFEIKKFITFEEELFSFTNSRLSDIIKILKIDTIIFLIKDIPMSDIINSFVHYSDRNIEFKMILPLSSSIVGSQSVVNIESLPEFKLNPIVKAENKVKKRMLDILISIFFILIFPLFLIKNKPGFLFRTLYKIIINQLSWVSYHPLNEAYMDKLPHLKLGVFNPIIPIKNPEMTEQEIFETNFEYAKNYKMMTDIMIIFNTLKISFDLRKFDKYYKLDKNG